MDSAANIPVVILCGGLGTRLREETESRPKPMIEIGTRPILWHIMKTYAAHGFRRFVLCLGYKGNSIRHYFLNYHAYNSDVTLRLSEPDSLTYHTALEGEDWQVTLAETGLHTMTGGRIGRVAKYLDSDVFCITYGDGVGDVDLGALLRFHRDHGRVGTITGVHPPGRFGEIEVDETFRVTDFNEKPQTTVGLINGGFMVMNRSFATDYLSESADLILERQPLQSLAEDGELMVHRHDGFWQPMDTFREYKLLNDLWDRGEAPWKVW